MISLLNASLLPWIAAASVPLVIHLLTRRARRRVDLPTVRFLERSIAHQSRLFRWRHLLLLICRTLAVLALVFTFLKPALLSPLAAAPGASIAAVVVLDVSASMGYGTGGVTSFARGRSQAIDAIRGLRAGDRANVVLCGAQPQPMFREPARDLGALEAAIRAAQVTEERADPTAAINVAAEQLARTTASVKRLYIVSDFQRTNWADAKLESLPPNTKVVFVRTDAGTHDNAGIVSVRVRPATPRIGQTVSVVCEVLNASSAARTIPVTLALSSGARFVQPVTAGPFSSATASFPLRFDSPQRVECTASIPGDAFALDDTRRAVIDLRQLATVVLITDEDAQHSPSGVYFLSRALDPGPQVQTGFRVVAVKPALLNNPVLHSADVVVVCDAPQMPEVQHEALARYATGGGNLVWFLYGDRIADQLKGFARHLPKADTVPFTIDGVTDLSGNGKGFVTLSEARYESPLLRAFKDPAAADIGRAHFRRFCVTSEIDRRAETLLKFEDDTAAVVRSSAGSGNLLFVNMSPSPGWSDLARQESFLPLVHEFLKGLMYRDTDTREFVAGGSASATVAPPAPGGKLRVACAGPEGPVPVTVEPITGSVVIERARRAGFYRLSSGGGPAATVAVNVHADESDLRSIDPRELEAPRQRAASVMAGLGPHDTGVGDLDKGRPLWPMLLIATVLALLAEQSLGRVGPRTQQVQR